MSVRHIKRTQHWTYCSRKGNKADTVTPRTVASLTRHDRDRLICKGCLEAWRQDPQRPL